MIIPIKDRVVIVLDPRKMYTDSGLSLPTNSQDREVAGVVLATGTDVIPEIIPGIRVLVGKHDGFALDNKYCDNIVGEIIMVRDEHVRAILE